MRIERDHKDQRGFALLIVLWIFMVLFVLGAEFASGMRQNAQATVNFDDETQSIIRAAVSTNTGYAEYSANEFKYRLDLKTLVQTNLQTGSARKVRPCHKKEQEGGGR